ncbi:27529_t:CDS:2, partial [Dentiscutata erythropus]
LLIPHVLESETTIMSRIVPTNFFSQHFSFPTHGYYVWQQPVVDQWTCKVEIITLVTRQYGLSLQPYQTVSGNQPTVLVEVQTERAHAWQPAGDRSACKESTDESDSDKPKLTVTTSPSSPSSKPK